MADAGSWERIGSPVSQPFSPPSPPFSQCIELDPGTQLWEEEPQLGPDAVAKGPDAPSHDQDLAHEIPDKERLPRLKRLRSSTNPTASAQEAAAAVGQPLSSSQTMDGMESCRAGSARNTSE